MEKIWDVTIMKMGSIQIEAETEDEAIKKAEQRKKQQFRHRKQQNSAL